MFNLDENYRKSMKLKDFNILTDIELATLVKQSNIYFANRNKVENLEPLVSCLKIYDNDCLFCILLRQHAANRFAAKTIKD